MGMATRKIQQRTIDTRAAIMQAGAELFASKGYAATGVREIAQAAGCNQALVSYHFGGKEKLYDAILGECIDSLVDAVAAYEKRADSPFRSLVHGFAHAFSGRENLVAIILREYLNPDRMLNAETGAILRRSMGLTEKMIARLPGTARAHQFDPQFVHLSIISPLVLFIAARPVREALSRSDPSVISPTIDEFAEQLARMLEPAIS